MVNSKKKGNRGEREVVKLLKDWWGGNFMRNLESGATSTLLEGMAPDDVVGRLAGDIMTPLDFPFCIEVKTYASIDIWGVVRSPTNNQIATWWRQCKNDAARAKKAPMLFMKEDRKKWHVIIPSNTLSIEQGYIRTVIDGDDVLIVQWDTFKEYYEARTHK